MKVQCCWPEVDILLTLGGTDLLLSENPKRFNRNTYGVVAEGSVDLTKKEALVLVEELNKAIASLDSIEESLDKYMEKK